eukprot:7589789-Heterocapsa_arctica.AAC.1
MAVSSCLISQYAVESRSSGASTVPGAAHANAHGEARGFAASSASSARLSAMTSAMYSSTVELPHRPMYWTCQSSSPRRMSHWAPERLAVWPVTL